MAKIFIVEDDKFLLTAYKARFKKAGLEFAIATDGEEALAKIDEFGPDLVLLDLMIPKTDGFVVLATLRNNPKYKQLPIVIASNLGQKEDIAKVKALGATDYLIKSEISIDDLVKRILTHIPSP